MSLYKFITSSLLLTFLSCQIQVYSQSDNNSSNLRYIFNSLDFSNADDFPRYQLLDLDNLTYNISYESPFGGTRTVEDTFECQQTSVLTGEGETTGAYACCLSSGISAPVNTSVENNWIISDYHVTDATVIEVIVMCESVNGYPVPDCRIASKIYFYESEDTLIVNTSILNEFTLVTSSVNAADDDGIIRASFDKTKKGFYVGIQNNGICTFMRTIQIYYLFCPAVRINKSSSLSEIPVPTLSNEPTLSNLICSEGSVSLQQAECYSNGSWIIPETTVCECDRGRKMSNQSCIVCPNNTYKFDIGNDNECMSCPEMSNTNDRNGSVLCECNEGWYRSEDEGVDTMCGRSPSVVRVLRLERGRESTRVSWTEPVDVWSRSVSYNVSLYLEKEGRVELVWSIRTGDTWYVLSESELGSTSREYMLVVTSLNNLVMLSGVENNVSVRFVSRFPEVLGMSVRLSDGMLEWKYRLEGRVSNLNFELKYTDSTGVLKEKTVSVCVVVSTPVYKCSVPVMELNESLNIVITLLPISPDVTNGTLSQTYNLNNPMVQNTISDKSISDNTIDTQIAVSVVVTCLILLVSVVIILGLLTAVYFRHQRRKSNNTATLYNNVYPMEAFYQDPGLYDDLNTAVRRFAKEIDHEDLEYKEYIGEGEFADVCKGILKKDEQRIVVAVKILKLDTSEKNKQDFFGEASIMGQFNHPNVIFLYGVTLAKPIVIITPFMENGSLDDFIRQKENFITIIQQIRICVGVACGMEYLTKIGFVHRDLAARNVLIDSEWTPKICDFGLSRETEEDLYNVKSGGKIPLRWTAPEAIAYRRFNEASDVWSFGVLVWEVTSFGRVPYAGIDITDLLEKVQDGYRLEKPYLCPDPLYNLMLSCWQSNARLRPTFCEVLITLNSLTVASFVNKQWNGVSVYNPETLSTEDWLDSIGLSRYSRHFQEGGYCSLTQTCSLTEEDLIRLGIIPLTHRSKILKSISEMHEIMQSVSISD